MSKVKPSLLNDPVTRLGLEFTYEQVVELLDRTADGMARRMSGSDREEFRLRARDVFIETFLTYNPKKSDFLRHLKFRLRTRLANMWRADRKFYRRIELKDPKDLTGIVDRKPVPRPDVLEVIEAGYDAILKTNLKNISDRTLGVLRETVVARLESFGWTKDRIQEAMDAAATLFGRK